jgi:hypothetical protein
MPALQELQRHAEELSEATGLVVEVIEEGGQLFVLLRKVPLPSGLFRLTSTDVLFITDQQYPLSALDMFWTEPDAIRPDGSIPQNADSMQTYLGRQWRRYSWHRNGVWNPARNGILDHFAFMESRWAAEKRK